MSRPQLRITAIVLFVVAYVVEIAYAMAPKHVAYPVAVGLHHYGIAALPSSWIVRACLLVQLAALALLVPFRALAAHASTTFQTKRSATVKAYMSGSESFGRRIHANEARLADLEHRVAADVAARVKAALAIERRLLADAEAGLAAERTRLADLVTGWESAFVAHRLERELGPAPVAPPAISVTAAAAIGESLRIAALQPVGAAAPPRRAPGADDSLTSIQGAPMSIISESSPELVGAAPESLNLAPVVDELRAPVAQLLNALFMAAKEKGAPALLDLLGKANVKVEALIEQAAAHQNPAFGALAHMLSGEVIQFLGGEENAAMIAVEAIAASTIAKFAGTAPAAPAAY